MVNFEKTNREMIKTSGKEEIILWSSFKEGDKPSFEKLFNQYYPVLFNYGHKFSHDNFILEESIQEMFIKLWKNRLNLGDPPVVKLYIFKAFRSILFRKVKYAASRSTVDLDDEHYDFSFTLAPELKIIEDENTEELRKTVQTALSLLTSRQREAIYLRFYEEMSYEQVAEMLQMNVKGTYKLLYRAFDRLRESLGQLLFTVLIASLNAKAIL